MSKTLLKRARVLLTAAFAVVSLLVLTADRCALCSTEPYHAPCLVNLSTGEVGEMTIYSPHPTIAGELAPEQHGGYFSLISCAGLQGYRDTVAWVASVKIEKNVSESNENGFCVRCRDMLRKYSQNGFVIADLYDEESPVLYGIFDGAEYKIREYQVSVTGVADQTITVQGLLAK